MAVVCGWRPRVWMWQLGVIGSPKCVVAIGYDWQLDVVGPPSVCGVGSSWMCLAPKCVAVAALGAQCVVMAIGLVPTSLEVPVVCGWCPRAWLWQLYVFDAQVC